MRRSYLVWGAPAAPSPCRAQPWQELLLPLFYSNTWDTFFSRAELLPWQRGKSPSPAEDAGPGCAPGLPRAGIGVPGPALCPLCLAWHPQAGAVQLLSHCHGFLEHPCSKSCTKGSPHYRSPARCFSSVKKQKKEAFFYYYFR